MLATTLDAYMHASGAFASCCCLCAVLLLVSVADAFAVGSLGEHTLEFLRRDTSLPSSRLASLAFAFPLRVVAVVLHVIHLALRTSQRVLRVRQFVAQLLEL